MQGGRRRVVHRAEVENSARGNNLARSFKIECARPGSDRTMADDRAAVVDAGGRRQGSSQRYRGARADRDLT